ncbi:MAG: type II secretion system F family protein [Candidatus Eremiobacterota bacterium]
MPAGLRRKTVRRRKQPHSEALLWARLRCPTQHVTLFTRQLATLLQAGIALPKALNTLASTTPDPSLSLTLREMLLRINEGIYLSRSLAPFRRMFPPVFVAMIRVGERTGALVAVLEKLSQWQERDDRLARRVRSALTYPAFVLILTVLLMLAMFLTVLPGFVRLFQDTGVPIPWMTRITFTLVGLVRNPGAWVIGAVLVLSWAGMIRERMATRTGRAQLFEVALAVPLLGSLLAYGCMARFTSAMATLLGSGVDLLKSLELAAQASGNPILQEDCERIARGLREGEHLCDLMEGAFPPTVVQLVAVGEETSRLEEMFARLSDLYDAEVHYLLDSLGSVLEPFLLGVVATGVGWTVLSIMLPLYGFLATLGG